VSLARIAAILISSFANDVSPADGIGNGGGLYADESLWAYKNGGAGTDGGGTGGAPEPSTWAMMVLGYAGLGYAGHRVNRKSVALAA
jgi:hypothetical protein